MKKVFIMLSLLLASQASLAGIRVLACEPEWAALALALSGKEVEVFTATTARQDPHVIQARPSLIAQARRADLLICSGAELEAGWLPLLLQKSANRRIQPGQPGHFMASQYVTLLDKRVIVDRSAGDVHMAGNPHIHTSPLNLLAVADALLPVIQQLMPDQASELQENHAAFTHKLQAALQRWQPQVHKLHGLRIVVHHDNWAYLNDWLQLEKVATLEPKPGVPPSTAHLASLLRQLQQQPADLIIHTTYQDGKAAQWLSARTGIPALTLPATVENWQEPDALLHWHDQLLKQLSGISQ